MLCFRKWFAGLTWTVVTLTSVCLVTFFSIFPTADIPFSFISEVCRFPHQPRPIPTIIYFLVSKVQLLFDVQDLHGLPFTGHQIVIPGTKLNHILKFLLSVKGPFINYVTHLGGGGRGYQLCYNLWLRGRGGWQHCYITLRYM